MSNGYEDAGASRASTTILMGTLARPGWDEHVRTLLDQTVPADEFLVVVDRPTQDDERAALHRAWPQLTFLFNEANLGLTRSLNAGLRQARGEIIFRADDDDAYFPTRIEKQLQLFEETGADLVSAWGEGTADGGKPYLIGGPTQDAAIKQALLKRNFVLHPALAFRRAAIERLGGYDETFLYAQDYALYLAAIRANLRFAIVPEPLVRRSYHSQSVGIARRYRQLMFSCSARVQHCAHVGDRRMFLRTLVQYGILAATPAWGRNARRKLFTWLGRGA